MSNSTHSHASRMEPASVLRASTQPYSFPFVPYASQLSLMNAIYSCIKEGNVGCFESPTGTGKSLSTICAAFTWLREEESHILERIENAKKIHSLSISTSSKVSAPETEDAGDWLSAFIVDYERKRVLPTSSSIISSAQPSAAIESDLLDSFEVYQSILKRIHLSPASAKNRTELLERARLAYVRQISHTSNVSVVEESANEEDDECLIKYRDDEDDAKDQGDSDLDEEQVQDETIHWKKLQLPRIIYCSRTHSQLSQFMQEIRKTEFRDMRCVTLAGRRNLCINSQVQSLASDAAMNERCLEMMKEGHQQRNTSKAKKPRIDTSERSHAKKDISPCMYKQRALEQQLGLQLLHHVQDIEDIVVIGKDQEICPYFAAKDAVRFAQVIAVPYTVLLHPDVREYFQLNLQQPNTVVLIDEAHNLVEAIAQSHSAEVTPRQLRECYDHVQAYLGRYQTRLHSKSLYFLSLFAAIIKKLYSFLQKQCSPPSSSSQAEPSHVNSATSLPAQILGVNELLVRVGMDHVNLFALRRFLVEAELVPRVASFAQRSRLQALAANVGGPSTGGTMGKYTEVVRNSSALFTCKADLQAVVSFFTSLTCKDEDGRVFLLYNSNNPSASGTTSAAIASENSASSIAGVGGKSSRAAIAAVAEERMQSLVIKYQLLSTASRFQTILQQAKSVVLLGGTMQPFQYFTSTIFPNHILASSRLRLFSCGHIISPSQLLPLILTSNSRPATASTSFSSSTTSAASSLLKWDFTHERRSQRNITDALAELLERIFATVPRGVVVFFSSYQYLDLLLRRWQHDQPALWRALNRHKTIHYETRSVAGNDAPIGGYQPSQTHVSASGSSSLPSTGNSSTVWESYCRDITECQRRFPEDLHRGAVLFSVLGGRLSEGINFSDDLARAVVVVGMPYPDTRDVVLQEKIRVYQQMSHLASTSMTIVSSMASSVAGIAAPSDAATDIATSVSVGSDIWSHAQRPSSSSSSNNNNIVFTGSTSISSSSTQLHQPSLPELLCMRSVNQAIGRAIRHHRDFAAVILVDQRYGSARVMQQLPAWMRQSMPRMSPENTSAAAAQHSWEEYEDLLRQFYERNYAKWSISTE